MIYEAMVYAREKHAGQVRKYTGNPYVDHLAEVAGIVATVNHGGVTLATAWLHDTIEDTQTSYWDIECKFGRQVADGVYWLTDDAPKEGVNRAKRKAKSCVRLAAAPGWVQTIKVADLISNTSSIVRHDPKFSVVYLCEKAALLDAMTKADKRLIAIARGQL